MWEISLGTWLARFANPSGTRGHVIFVHRAYSPFATSSKIWAVHVLLLT